MANSVSASAYRDMLLYAGCVIIRCEKITPAVILSVHYSTVLDVSTSVETVINAIFSLVQLNLFDLQRLCTRWFFLCNFF